MRKMGRRKEQFTVEQMIKENKFYKQLLKRSDPNFDLIFSGFIFKKLKDQDFDFSTISFLKKELSYNESDLLNVNKKIPTVLIYEGINCYLEGFNHEDFNSLFYYKNVEKEYYKDFTDKIKDPKVKQKINRIKGCRKGSLI